MSSWFSEQLGSIPTWSSFGNNNNNNDFATTTNESNSSNNDKNNDDATNNGTTTTMMTSYQRYDNSNNNNTKDLELEIDIDDAIERLGMGIFQYKILVAAGLCFAADAMEVLLLSFLAIILKVEWNLTPHETDTIISIVFLGALLGTLVLGPLGDKIGRKPVFSITAIIIAIAGLVTAIVTSYTYLLIVRFIVGFGVGGLVIPFDTLAEFIPTSYRGQNLLYIEFFWTAGTLCVPLLAWYSLGNSNDDDDDESSSAGNWRLFVALCAIPCIISTALGLLYVPESPHWLVTKGKYDKALEILRLAAKRNGLNPMDVFPLGTKIKEPVESTVNPVVVQHANDELGFNLNELKILLSPKWLYTTLRLWIVWFVFGILYYGVIIVVSLIFSIHEINENDADDGNAGSYDFDYSAILISASSEIFGLIVVLCTIDKYGRIQSQVVTYGIGGFICFVLCMIASVSSNDFDNDDFYNDGSSTTTLLSKRNILLLFAFIARMLMMGATCTTWVSTSEILTTEIRGTGHSASNAMARLGGFICPYIINDETNMSIIGTFLLILATIAAYTSSQLPETMGKALGGNSGNGNSNTKGSSSNLLLEKSSAEVAAVGANVA